MINSPIIVLTDANTNIGYGHLNRCIELKKKYPDQFELYSLSFNKSKFVKKLNWLNSKNYLKKLKEKIILIDYPKISKDFIKKVRKISKKIILFYNGETFKGVDLYININKINFINKEKQLNGPKFTIINSEIKKKNTNIKYDYLVSLGQSKNNINKHIIFFLNKIHCRSVVISNESREYKKNSKVKFFKIKDKKTFNKLMNQSKIIITSASQTAFEALYLKKKILVIKTSNNQNSNLKFFKNQKIINFESFSVFKNPKLIYKKLNNNIYNKKIILDKFGVDRIWAKIKKV